MPDFAQWLSRQNDKDPSVRDLKVAASEADKAGTWPSASNKLADYQAAVAEKDPTKRDTLLTTLGQMYERWFQNEREHGLHFGTIALLFAGLVIGATIIYNIFFNSSFFQLLGDEKNARGLITFLFAFGTIAIMVVVAVALFWMDVNELEERFGKAKDLLMILIGILGTIIGFYFGATNLSSTTNVSPSKISISTVTLSTHAAVPGDKITITAKATGGTAPYTYDVLFADPSGKVDTSTLSLRNKASETGDISEQVQLPADIATPSTLSVQLVVRDKAGATVSAEAQTLTVSPKT